MKTKSLLRFLVAAIGLSTSITSCKKDNNLPPPPQQTDVYAIINQYSPTEQCFLWKNGTKTLLGNGKAIKIFVSDNDVYVVGYEEKNGKSSIKLWKNGSLTLITDGANNAFPTSVFVSGKDVYISGYEQKNGVFLAKYWKNGTPNTLSLDETKASQANDIFVSEGKVYVAGYEDNGTKNVAKYWKGGLVFTLSDGSYNEGCTSIFVSGNDVYLCGFRLDNGKYIAKTWQKGVATELTASGAVSAWTSRIVVNNGKVYIAGRVGKYATLWENNAPKNMGADKNAYDVCVKSSDVYLTGVNSTGGKYKALMWKNDVETELTDGTAPSDANGIFVK